MSAKANSTTRSAWETSNSQRSLLDLSMLWQACDNFSLASFSGSFPDGAFIIMSSFAYSVKRRFDWPQMVRSEAGSARPATRPSKTGVGHFATQANLLPGSVLDSPG